MRVHIGNLQAWNIIAIFISILAAYELCQIHLELLLYKQIWHLENSTFLIPNKFVIYAVTPTRTREVQKAELTAISQMLRLSQVPIHWIVVEDSRKKTPLITGFLKELNLTYTHLAVKNLYPDLLKVITTFKLKGVAQRNEGLKWIRRNLKHENGAVYFMDDDNIYDYRIFQEIAKIKRIGVWPVAFAGGGTVETPIVNASTGKVDGFLSGWEKNRTFPIDMAGFAINLKLILEKSNVFFSYHSRWGMIETDFLKQLTTVDQLEPLASNCTKVYVWHTKSQRTKVYEIFPNMEV